MRFALFFVVLGISVTLALSSRSNRCTVTESYRYRVHTSKCYTSGWWWWRRRCCYPHYYYQTRYRARQICCRGYVGSKCDVPVCTSRCQNKGVCVAPNTCECPNQYTGNTCVTKKCSWATDCYPGICQGSAQCVCSAEFEGRNCQTMKEGPTFTKCIARLLEIKDGVEKVVAETNCTSEVDEVLTYTSQNEFTHVGLEWTPSYRKLEDLPPKPTEGYLRNFRVGVISTAGHLLLKATDGAEALRENITCSGATASNKNPHESISCIEEYSFTRGVRHLQQLDLTMSGITGGYKEVRNDNRPGYYANRTVTGSELSQVATFWFDLEAPTHCIEADTCDVDGIQPIVIDADIRKDPEVTLTFAGWNDTDSSLKGYTYHVYSLTLFPDEGILQNSTDPVLTKSYGVFEETANSSFTLPEPGMYSILGVIKDFADNKRYARAFVLYGNASHGIVETEEPITVTPGPGSEMIDKAFWLSTLSGSVTVSWRGRYRNNFIANNQYNAPISPLHHHNLLDFTYGNISAAGTTAEQGITGFSYALVHRIQKSSQDPPTQWIDLEAGVSETELVNVERNNGDGYTFWIKARDMMRNELTDFIYIRADSTPPITSSQNTSTFIKNVQSDFDGYFSSVEIATTDAESGILRIDFELYDILQEHSPRLIKASTQKGQLVENDDDCAVTGTCLCTNQNECYTIPQRVRINNCWLLKYLDVPVRLQATIVNRARLTTNISTDLGIVEDLNGVGMYPAARSLRLKDVFGYSAILTWYLPASCYGIRNIYIVLTGGRGGSAQLSSTETEVEMKDLVPYTKYLAELYLLYEGRRESEKIKLMFNTGAPPNPQDLVLGIGSIIGIAVGGLLFCTIVVIVILIIVRIKQKKPAVPARVRKAGHSIIDRFSRRFVERTDVHGWPVDPPPYTGTTQSQIFTLNVAYTSGPKLRDFEEDLYSYGELETDPEATWKHSDDKVTIGKTIHSGRFAVIKEGIMRDNNGARKVALKMVKNSNNDDILLMKAKMNFMATVVPNHNNIVNFVGAITQGPILILEHCECPLKDWLRKNSEVTDDVDDNFINFSTDVARGMQHLHENEILHRRLGARNVLLKKVALMGRAVAKITGFGPMNGEQSGNVEADKERIPMKWMALEQLGIKPGDKRPYTMETDVWSYGVTMWEVFSAGDTPYDQTKSSDVRALLEKGERLGRPDNCLEEMYDDLMTKCWLRSPAKRPSFADITASLERLYHGAPDGDVYCADVPRDLTDEDLYDDVIQAGI